MGSAIRWAPVDYHYYHIPTATVVVLTTDRPCHLTLHYYLIPPYPKTITTKRRGLLLSRPEEQHLPAPILWEQQEEGDTLEHTWGLEGPEPWITNYCYIRGTIGGLSSPSTTPPLDFYGPWPPPPTP